MYLDAICIARPVIDLQLKAARGVVLSSGPDVAYVEVDNFVICVCRDAIPRLPNCIVTRGDVRDALVPGLDARLTAGCLRAGDAKITWSTHVPVWESKVATAPAGPGRVAARGVQIMGALGHHPGGTKKVDELVEQLITGLGVASSGEDTQQLFDALADDDSDRVSRAAHRLLGRGPGLTPEGDDLLTAVAGTLVVVGQNCGVRAGVVQRLLHALLPPDRHERTTALSVILLELATRGHLAEPLHPLLEFESKTATVLGVEVSKLLGIGRSTGRAYAIGVAATLLTLSSTTAPGAMRAP